MKIALRTIVLVLVLGTLVAGGIAVADNMSIVVKTKDGVGKYLADGKGMTLYYFKKDSPGKSACEGPCVERWPLFYTEKVMVEGLKSEDFGTITRTDGKKQTTYKGMPLYYFFKDTKPGDTIGHGVNDVWFVAAP